MSNNDERLVCGHDLRDRSPGYCMMCRQLNDEKWRQRIRKEAIEECSRLLGSKRIPAGTNVHEMYGLIEKWEEEMLALIVKK